MQINDTVVIRAGPWEGWSAVIIDDCFRMTEERCTMLVRLSTNPDVEIEINVEDVKPYGKDV